MSDLPQIRIAEDRLICNILPHKKLSRSQQHLMTEAPNDPPCSFDGIDKRRKLGTPRWECRVQERSIFVDMLADNNLQHRLVA
jgi:hypothetical protein